MFYLLFGLGAWGVCAGNVKAFAFYRVAQLTLAVVRSAEEGGGSSGTPKFAISLKMNDGQGLPRVLSTSGRPLVQPSCFQAEQKSNTVTLGDKEAAFIVGYTCNSSQTTHRHASRCAEREGLILCGCGWIAAVFVAAKAPVSSTLLQQHGQITARCER